MHTKRMQSCKVGELQNCNLREIYKFIDSFPVQVNMQNIVRGAQALFPPSIDILKGYFEMGFRDALKFLIENDLIEREEGTSV